MKIAFDGSAFWETGMTYEEQYDTVARAGYEYINPYNADFPGFWKRPKATKEEVLRHKKAIANAGLKIASLTTGFHWQDPDEFVRQYAVDCWKKMFEIGELMDIRVFNTRSLAPARQSGAVRSKAHEISGRAGSDYGAARHPSGHSGTSR